MQARRAPRRRPGAHRPTQRPFSAWTLPAEHPDLAFEPVVHAARALADNALQYRRLAPVRALVTSAVQQKKCEVDELVAEADAGPRNNSAMLRRAVADLRDGTRSIAKAEAIEILRRSPVPEFDANVSIVMASGIELATVDGRGASCAPSWRSTATRTTRWLATPTGRPTST
jgi:hypothetical protein